MSIVMVRLLGGLANQMFQYALGRKLAIETGALLRFDVRDLNDDELRSYELDVFNHKGSIADHSEMDFFRLENKEYFKIISEKGFNFDKSVFNSTSPVYITGYWQSSKYFDDIRSVLKNDFTLSQPLSSSSVAWLSHIASTNSISVHVRRGDYISNSHTNNYHGAVSLKYLQNAMNLLLALEQNREFFVFSDDLDWVAEHITIAAPLHFVEGNRGIKSAEDLILMSNCKHNIMSNSSFSWWGTWLNDNQSRRVIAPRPWFKAPGLDTSDLMGDDWILLSI